MSSQKEFDAAMTGLQQYLRSKPGWNAQTAERTIAVYVMSNEASDAFAEGLNRFLKNHPELLPAQAQMPFNQQG